MTKNYNAEWLFLGFVNMVTRNSRMRTENDICRDDRTGDYFDVMSAEQIRGLQINKLDGLVKDYPSYKVEMPIKNDYHLARLSFEFDRKLVWRDESGEVHFNNGCTNFAVRFWGDKDYPEISNTFDTMKEGMWIHSVNTCHTDTLNGGTFEIPSVIVSYFDDFLRLILSENCLATYIKKVAAQQERNGLVGPVRILIVDDTPETYYDNEDY